MSFAVNSADSPRSSSSSAPAKSRRNSAMSFADITSRVRISCSASRTMSSADAYWPASTLASMNFFNSGGRDNLILALRCSSVAVTCPEAKSSNNLQILHPQLHAAPSIVLVDQWLHRQLDLRPRRQLFEHRAVAEGDALERSR